MRVLLLSWEYPPVIEGGLGRHVTQLAAGLAAAGHDVSVLTRAGTEDAGEPEASGRGPVHVHRVPIAPFSADLDGFMAWVGELNERLFARGAALAGGGRFDLIHSHDWMVAPAAEALAAAHDLPWLVTVHATEFGRHNGWVHTHPQRAIHRAERRMVRTAGHVICCSEYMAGHVRRVFGLAPGRVSAIPNGIAPAELEVAPGTDVAALRRRHAPGGEPLVLLVGRLVYEKGFHVSLEAIAALVAAGRPVRFLLAGTGTAEAELHAQAESLGLREAGVFLGRVDDDTLHGLYRAADVTVVPSLYEPFGIVPLEAMACGCPVIVTDTGGLREVTDAPGVAVRVPPGDVRALTGALAGLLDAPARRAAMAAAGRAHAARFDWRQVAGQTEGVYAELLSAGAAVTPALA
ncbi:glycosyltransferase family 4 protein [Conexibacter sp. DBS9H8]|uniref:glycosyltransferase family 4 protein n=1 Tax=Conexibacter sp. DBS9H8 TaxID=2937801 RepID=UPI0020103F63|nr:glycosyltransferase family 4 protein [Conexibacter sp. DBS9H8]